MKIMFINSVVDYGSTGKIVRELANGLKSRGNSVIIAYGRHEAKTEKDTFNITNKWSTVFHIIMTRFFGRHGMHSNYETKKLIKKIEEFKPDTIHLHNLHGYYLNVPMLLSFLKDKDIKILWTLHDAWLISGSSAYFDFNGCKLWDQGCVECVSTKDYPKVIGFKRQKKNFAWKKKSLLTLQNLTLFTPSLWLKDMLSQSFLKDVPTYVVNNGIDTEVFKPTISSELRDMYGDKKILLGVANIWEHRKGFQDFIKLKELISEDYLIILIGLSKDQISSLPKGIVGVQRTQDAHELAAYYSLAYAYINPTYEDNYPTTNLEALACGTRVIAYDTGGNKEVLGVEIVEQGNVQQLYKKISEKHENSVDSYSFSKENFLENMLEFY